MRSIRKRRQQRKTDYKARMNLLKSGKPRLVIRKTNKYLSAQIVETDVAQDKTLVSVSSKDLLSSGWPKDKSGSLKNKSASYLTGQLLASKAKSLKLKEIILDLGLNRNIHKSRLYYLAKGAKDGGLKILSGEKALPTEDDLKTEEIKAILPKISK